MALRHRDVIQGRVLTDQLVTIVDDKVTAVAPWHGAPADGLVTDTIPGAQELTEDEMRAAVDEAKQYGSYAIAPAVAGDPLADISVLEHPSAVMKGGEIIRSIVRRLAVLRR